MNCQDVAGHIGISDITLQKITDCVFFVEGQRRENLEPGHKKRNIALQLKCKKSVSIKVKKEKDYLKITILKQF